MSKLKVLLADSSVASKRLLNQAVTKTGLAEVERVAASGLIALEKLQQSTVDVVILGASLEEEEQLLAVIREHHPAVFVISMGQGAVADDTSPTLESGLRNLRLEPGLGASNRLVFLTNQLQGLFTQIMTWRYTSPANSSPLPVVRSQVDLAPAPVLPGSRWGQLKGANLVVMASSTGGTRALEIICSSLPAGFARPVLVVQHMPVEMTKKLAWSLSKKSRLPVLEAEDGMLVKSGQVVLAPGGQHMAVRATKTGVAIKLEVTPAVNGVRPAADVLFGAVAGVYSGQRVLAVILTGMGSDGQAGVIALKNSCDCFCMAQSERTCTVYGMPKSVVEAGLADAVEDLDVIPRRIIELAVGRDY